ncbi:MAG: hypothetical protein EP330_03855 [Deltaproteobacteria bacterium]|nr:MAG: hypothetical protein EP330_03855 [Deltaproteobacteria bacterium]
MRDGASRRLGAPLAWVAWVSCACSGPVEPRLDASPPPLVAAVLPWTPPTPPEDPPGLGRALSALVTADLVEVPALTLVERDRLDALLDELALSKTTFIDPATAVTAGKGLGADLVILGGYALVDDRFAMDGRIVQVETGVVLDAEGRDGPREDWVEVEKSLVASLADRLDRSLAPAVEARMRAQRQTEALEAAAAWGRALEATDAPSRRAQLEAALAVDPAFPAALAELAALRDTVETARLEDLLADAHDEHAALSAALTALPSELDQTGKADAAQQAALALRVHLLPPCEATREWEHYLDRHAWSPPRRDLRATVVRLARTHGVDAEDSPTDPVVRLARLVSSAGATQAFGDELEPDEGLLALAARCDDPPALAERAERWAQSLADHDEPATWTGVSLAEQATLHAMYRRARVSGSSASLSESAATLLADHPRGTDGRDAVLKALDRVLGAARRHQAWRGAHEGTLYAFAHAVVTGEPSMLETEHSALCTQFAMSEAPLIRSYAEEARPQGRLMPYHGHPLGRIYARWADFGCLDGHAARLTDAGSAVALLASAPAHKDRARADEPACRDAFEDAALEVKLRKPFVAMGAVGVVEVSGLMDTWYELVQLGCIAEPVP